MITPSGLTMNWVNFFLEDVELLQGYTRTSTCVSSLELISAAELMHVLGEVVLIGGGFFVGVFFPFLVVGEVV